MNAPCSTGYKTILTEWMGRQMVTKSVMADVAGWYRPRECCRFKESAPHHGRVLEHCQTADGLPPIATLLWPGSVAPVLWRPGPRCWNCLRAYKRRRNSSGLVSGSTSQCPAPTNDGGC